MTSPPLPVLDGPQLPFLHDLVTCLAAPTAALSGHDGQIRRLGAQGVFSADVRVLALAEVTVDGNEPESIAAEPSGAASAEFIGVVRRSSKLTLDPTFWIRRQRTVLADGMDEQVVLVNTSLADATVSLRVVLVADLADMQSVKMGRRPAPAPSPVPVPDGFTATSGAVEVTVSSPGVSEIEINVEQVTFRWTILVPARGTAKAGWALRLRDPAAVVRATASGGRSSQLSVTTDNANLQQLIRQSTADIQALTMTTPAGSGDEFMAGGSPWHLTLFGRDSLWAARMSLPLGTRLAAGTLRTLARRQGKKEDIATAEAPGKILHEIRRPMLSAEVDPFLPPVYYGTIDATLLWVCLLVDAWRWGMPRADVEALLPAAKAALTWMRDYGDSDGDGFLEYIDTSGRGLANQGWKDSRDSIRFADGTIAEGPVALAEVQSYAFEAATGGAELLDSFGLSGAARWRDYAEQLAGRFREKFWVRDELGPYPALALDGNKTPVDGPASNMGHLLGGGMLTPAEETAIAARLLHPTMFSGFGIRTMSSTSGGYSALSYHCGSVWPHDTVIAIKGLLRAGFSAEGAKVAAGLLSASGKFRGRLPELFGGFSSKEFNDPIPYPAACTPQAWAATVGPELLRACLGLRPDVPAGKISISPLQGFGAVTAAGMQVAGADLSVQVAGDSTVMAVDTSAGLSIEIALVPDRDPIVGRDADQE